MNTLKFRGAHRGGTGTWIYVKERKIFVFFHIFDDFPRMKIYVHNCTVHVLNYFPWIQYTLLQAEWIQHDNCALHVCIRQIRHGHCGVSVNKILQHDIYLFLFSNRFKIHTNLLICCN